MLSFIKKIFVTRPVPRQKPEYYNIICPYCFHKFKPEEVVFRATHTRDDDDEFMERIDENLSKWRKRFKADEVYMEAVIDPVTIPDENRIYSEKVLVGVVDRYGEVTRRRLCPECHNVLPVSAGKVPSNIISVIGASQVGKSVFIASLVHTLQNKTAVNFDASCIAMTPEVGNRFNNRFIRPIFENNTMIATTSVNEQMDPYIFEFKFKDDNKETLTLVFFDVAGEGMTSREYLEIQAEHIKNSSGIMFLVDPLQIRSIRDKIHLKLGTEEQNEFSSKYDEPTMVISGLYENFIAHQPNSRTNIPTAVVLTKSDMLHYLKEEDSDYIQPNSNVFRNVVHKEYLNNIEFENINGEIGRFLQKVDQSFKSAVDVYFTNKAYFAVSALGSNPKNTELSGVVSPIRVDEPFIWLLNQLGYIDRRDT
ncbi:TRAFAC clade GTPase domain-containing protein [Paenibacillus thalictri]|uniref:Double-GTPase 2 domain-containing protein n=1 Tax=Paenibacillus thalictri TaxID=2527873 RepID=A0A4Q9DYK2_9BACL|nr:hypothetical protein [Paenibacillus thalictri]TBL80983.1 hypothetical protein EYB31_02460 [Paenibacillus thalictri]